MHGAFECASDCKMITSFRTKPTVFFPTPESIDITQRKLYLFIVFIVFQFKHGSPHMYEERKRPQHLTPRTTPNLHTIIQDAIVTGISSCLTTLYVSLESIDNLLQRLRSPVRAWGIWSLRTPVRQALSYGIRHVFIDIILIVQWITMKIAVSRVKMPAVRPEARSQDQFWEGAWLP